jgi:microcystin-dependent protein
MSQPFIGEIRIFAGNFAPAGWLFCDGALLAISDYDTLFNLIGTTYGGDGDTTFALPDLRGRVPVHAGNGYTLAETGGVESVMLTTNQIPTHRHQLIASTDVATLSSPANTLPGQATSKPYRLPGTTAVMAASTLASTGSGAPHDNLQPYLAVNYIISPFGVFPSSS